MSIHPKTSGAAVGSALGVLIVAILQSIHGVHLSVELPAAIAGFLAIFGAWIAPSGSALTVPVATPAPAPTVVVPVSSNRLLDQRAVALDAREQALNAREAAILPPPPPPASA